MIGTESLVQELAMKAMKANFVIRQAEVKKSEARCITQNGEGILGEDDTSIG